MNRNQMINKLSGNFLDVDINWLRENDPEMIDWVRDSQYWDTTYHNMNEILNNLWMRISFSDNGTGYTFTSDLDNIDVSICLADQPFWGENKWEDWLTEEIKLYYDEFLRQ